jgi:hypothetical protein
VVRLPGLRWHIRSTHLFFILKKLQLVKTDFGKQLSNAADLIDAEEKNMHEEAMTVAELLHIKYRCFTLLMAIMV